MPTNLRSFRVDDQLWEAAQEVARVRLESLSADVLRPALERYVERFADPSQPEPWFAALAWSGMPAVGSGPVVVVFRENEQLPEVLQDPLDNTGQKVPGVWHLDGIDAQRRIAHYMRID